MLSLTYLFAFRSDLDPKWKKAAAYKKEKDHEDEDDEEEENVSMVPPISGKFLGSFGSSCT